MSTIDVERLARALDLCGIGLAEGGRPASEWAAAIATEYAAEPPRAFIEWEDTHTPWIRFEAEGATTASGFPTGGLPYLACSCGWDDRGDSGWSDHLAAALYDAGLRPSPPASPRQECEHEWSDCDDDEEAWYCPKCGLTEHPGEGVHEDDVLDDTEEAG